LLLPAWSSPNPGRLIGVGFFVAGGATLVGSALGFLFGVPTYSGENREDASYSPNTNLERVSSWLTQVLIGATLVQASELLATFTRLARYVGPAFGDSPAGPTIAGALIIHYLLVGFFQGFLLAYLWLPHAFARSVEAGRKRQAGPERLASDTAMVPTDE